MRGFKGGMFGGEFRMGRKFAAGDLQLVILALLGEQPRHGYELIKILEERSGGFYVPSPGVIYPALTYLEETGLAEVEAEGAKKLYRITEAGRSRVEENRAMILHTFAKLERIGEKMAHVKRFFETDRHGADEGDDGDFMQDGGDIRAARVLLRSALRMRYPWSKPEAARIAGILERAATEILQGGRLETRG
ncbi:DNA-binding PadR family transcriptional regulator [Rhizobium leguminosarum]|uniref:DNA-binding PadR family transcriptional regulator n=1 Tax=Rhizobium leguminosarum TaxID=384 RepID=A0AAE2ML19_RHILE|nr:MULTISPECIES: PadR family transcriptional regulator [Rhizobium]MBB4291080.1 DNA-binding PadR family transcriptional regulator [Rhizobium leguminosarum]MBB4297824.1 DNA-binding PadR family transcriptional regulator [Rhizobium leguminosarum]MBB4308963.1 DNA-binding PadR family transcriptional regulator [Rhizobium leguminosarum]MBB4416800.1 DNA-binding PadR family transcriptional regulator [Rhizobium leguminosarum]MBB4430231.1 DNA-binding PadR family transcriptional regulator [Rhizobium espera